MITPNIHIIIHVSYLNVLTEEKSNPNFFLSDSNIPFLKGII